MIRKFVAEEIPSTLVDTENIAIQNQYRQSPYNLAYLVNETSIRVKDLFNLNRSTIEFNQPILDFQLYQNPIGDSQRIATLHTDGSIGVTHIKFGVEQYTTNIDTTPIQLNGSQFQLLCLIQDEILVRQDNTLHSRVWLNGLFLILPSLKLNAPIKDIKWSIPLQRYFILTNERLYVCCKHLTGLETLLEFNGPENVIQVAPFDRLPISNSDGDYYFAVMTDTGDITVWSVKLQDEKLKLNEMVEKLSLFAQSSYNQTTYLKAHPDLIKMQLDHFGTALLISGPSDENSIISYIVQLNPYFQGRNDSWTIENYPILQSVCFQKANEVKIPEILSISVHQDYASFYFQAEGPVDLNNIRQVDEFLQSTKPIDTTQLAYLFSTSNNDQVKFYWVYYEGLFFHSLIQDGVEDAVLENDQPNPIQDDQPEASPLKELEAKSPDKKIIIEEVNAINEESFGLEEEQKVPDKKKSHLKVQSQTNFETSSETRSNASIIKDITEDKDFINQIALALQEQFNKLDDIDLIRNQFKNSCIKQFEDMEQQIEFTLRQELNGVAQFCEGFLQEKFSHENVSKLVQEQIDRQIVIDAKPIIQQSTDDYFQQHIIPMYKREFTELQVNVNSMLNQTLKIFEDSRNQDVEKLRQLRKLLEDMKDQLGRLIKAVEDLKMKQYNDTHKNIGELWQTMSQIQAQLEGYISKLQVIQPTQKSHESQQTLMGYVNQLMQLQAQMATPNALSIKTLHSVLNQLIAQLQSFIITLER